ncbi:MAG: ABC-2 family transporter protein [Dehalogenimonas sp.]
MRYLRLATAFFRIALLGELAYRANFWWRLFQSILNLGVALSGVWVIFSYTDSLGGWRPEEVVALVGVYLLVGGIMGLVIQPGMEELIESVRTGELDFILTKPEDGQLLVSIRRYDIWEIIDFFLGAGVLIVALTRLGSQIGLIQATEFILLLVCGGIIVYCFWLMLSSLSFWLVRVENILVIFQSLYEAGRWPISLYPGWLRYGLTFIIPVAFAVTVPTEALTGRLNWLTVAGAATLAVGLFILSRIIWKAGMRRYSGASA